MDLLCESLVPTRHSQLTKTEVYCNLLDIVDSRICIG
jgi:hypothetical protein